MGLLAGREFLPTYPSQYMKAKNSCTSFIPWSLIFLSTKGLLKQVVGVQRLHFYTAIKVLIRVLSKEYMSCQTKSIFMYLSYLKWFSTVHQGLWLREVAAVCRGVFVHQGSLKWLTVLCQIQDCPAFMAAEFLQRAYLKRSVSLSSIALLMWKSQSPDFPSCTFARRGAQSSHCPQQ